MSEARVRDPGAIAIEVATLRHNRDQLEQLVETMRQETRRLQTALVDMQAERDMAELGPAPGSIEDTLRDASPDEYQLVQDFALKVMGEGRREYGALDLETDSRTPLDLVREALDEWQDQGSYLMMVRRKLEDRARVGTAEARERLAVRLEAKRSGVVLADGSSPDATEEKEGAFMGRSLARRGG